MKKTSLVIRLRRLYILELIGAFFLPLAFCVKCYSEGQPIGPNSIIAMSLNGVLLLEGSFLWYSITRQLTTNYPDSFTSTFKVLKKINLVLITLSITTIAILPFAGPLDKIGSLAFLLLAVLEHINYFEIQLMYDSVNDWKYLRKYGLKKAKLKRLMAGVKEEAHEIS